LAIAKCTNNISFLMTSSSENQLETEARCCNERVSVSQS